MATRIVTTYIDDLDGSTEDVRTVRFSVDSAHYEIDLNEAHTDELIEALKKYTAAGRRISAPQAVAPRGLPRLHVTTTPRRSGPGRPARASTCPRAAASR